MIQPSHMPTVNASTSLVTRKRFASATWSEWAKPTADKTHLQPSFARSFSRETITRSTMAGASRLGLNKKIHKPSRANPIKRGSCVVNVMDYLKSDSFLYSSLISSPQSFSNSDDLLPISAHDENAIEVGSNKTKASEEMKEYMKSDSYLYAPLLKLTHPPSSPTKARGKQVNLKKVSRSLVYTNKMSTREIPHKKKS